MAKIYVDIDSCVDCPNFVSERMYTSDSFEVAFNWFCSANGRKKKIAGYVEREETPIPDWCPKLIHKIEK